MNAGVWAQTDYNSSPTTNSECSDGAVEVTGCQGRIAHVSLRRGASGMRKPPVVMGAHQLGLGERWPSARLLISLSREILLKLFYFWKECLYKRKPEIIVLPTKQITRSQHT
jgi:hypothetical protein